MRMRRTVAFQPLNALAVGRGKLLDHLNHAKLQLLLDACDEGFAFLDALDLRVGELLLQLAMP